MSETEFVRDLASVLALERVDRDLFRGVNSVGAKVRTTLYGGQVAEPVRPICVPRGRGPDKLVVSPAAVHPLTW